MTATPNMSLTLPVPGVTAGPAYASQEVAALTTIDAHDHTSGRGIAVPTAGLNINADLSIGGYNLNAVNGLRLVNLTTTPASSSDVRMVYSKNGELAYRDAAGNEVLITASGSVAGATGTITGLTSPASAVFSSVTNTFTFSKDSSKPGKLAISDINIYEYDNASANAITLKSPASLASAYSWVLPTAGAAGAVELVTVDSSGTMDTAPLAGTSNQITVTQALNGVTLSLPSTVQTSVYQGSLGTASAPAYAFTSDSNTGMFSNGADQLSFATNGVKRVEINVNGMYGISGSLATPGYTFDADSDTGMYLAASNQVGIVGGGSLLATFASSKLDLTTGIEIAGGGTFKVKVFTGTVGASGFVTLSAPSGVILSVSGWSQNNTDYKAMITGDVAFACGLIHGVILNAAGNTTSSVTITNLESSNRVYRVVMFYI